jgi:hypothetical protein
MKKLEAALQHITKQSWYWPLATTVSLLLCYVTVSIAIDTGNMLQWALGFSWLFNALYSASKTMQRVKHKKVKS